MYDNFETPKSPLVEQPNQAEARRKLEDAVRSNGLKLPKEVAQLFIDYTRWIWDYKCLGAVHKYYCDQTVFHGSNGFLSVGAEATLSGTIRAISAFPDQIVEFVDIFVEGNEEDGYRFGQSTIMRLKNNGWSEFGPPTGKSLSEGDRVFHSICELSLKKMEGRWRVYEEWVVEGSKVWRQTLTLDPARDDTSAGETSCVAKNA